MVVLVDGLNRFLHSSRNKIFPPLVFFFFFLNKGHLGH